MSLIKVPEALEVLKRGEMVILVDDEDRENEGDLCMAAELVRPQDINFMATFGRGLICLSLEAERIKALELPQMTEHNNSGFGTAFTVSIEAKEGVTTGISAADRAHTIRTAVADGVKADDLARPGHVFPLRAQPGGVLVRAGQTEGSVDLMRLAGLKGAGVICEIMNEDGTMARLTDLEKFSKEHNIPIISNAEIIRHRLATESLVKLVAAEKLFTKLLGEVRVNIYESVLDGSQHLAVVKGDLTKSAAPLVRVSSPCPNCAILDGLFCDCHESLIKAAGEISRAGCGILLNLQQKNSEEQTLADKLAALVGRKTAAYKSEPYPYKGGTVSNTLRSYGIGAQILRHLGLGPIKLLVNRNTHLPSLEGFGISIAGFVSLAAGGEEPPKSAI